MTRFEVMEEARGGKNKGDPRRFSVWENDGSEDGRLVGGQMTKVDADKIAHLLNASHEGMGPDAP